MPHKIGFVVVSSSGHEDNYNAKELMVHAPTVNGWRSARFCPYPQEITLQLVERCRIRKLQLLAHQYMISAKIEFYISDSLPESFSPNPSDRFCRLGYVSLSDNEKTGFKARELKSVHVDAVGTYLKLIFHKNHINRYNLYNQVALVAINVLGDSVDSSEMDVIPTRDQLIEHYLNSIHNDVTLEGTYLSKSDSISPLDDLAFDMYQDPEVAQIIRQLDEKKHEAVRQERFDLAKKLKQAIADLQKVGEHLGRYEVEKRCAIDKEDYDLAKQKKQQMDEYRLKVYQQLEIHNLLDMGSIRKMADLPLEPLSHPASPQQVKPAEIPPQKKRDKKPEKPPDPEPSLPARPMTPLQTPSPPSTVARPEPPKISVSALPYDERPLPALRKQTGERQSQLEESPPPDSSRTPRTPGITGEPEPLTEKALREATFAIEVYGEGLVAGAYSKTWSYREDALVAVYKKLMDVPSGMPKEELKTLLRAAIFLVRKSLSDKVSSVFQASLKLLKMVITQFIPKHKLGRVEAAHCLEQTWPNLILRTGDSATRLRVVATNFIQEMALFKEVRPLQVIPAELVKPMKSNTPSRLALSQVELLEKLLKELGTDGSGFTINNVMRFAIGALEHSTSEVRETASRIIQDMYRQHKSAITDYLPLDDASTRRNVLYKNIFDGFAKIDGRPAETQTKTLKKAARQEAEKEKKEEIRALQEQLAALKDLTTNGKDKNKVKDKEAHKPTKAGFRKVPPAHPPDIADDDSSFANYLDNLCIFCGEKDDSFTEEGLDLHYWKHCPMLSRCDLCRQVVEIASMSEHLLSECESKSNLTKCQRCAEAVPKDELSEHVRSKACNPPKSEKLSNHCSLCHENFTPGDEAWKAHLMGRDGCKQNSRRVPALQRTQQIQGKMGPSATKQAPLGMRGRSMATSSKIPAPRAGVNKMGGRNPVKR
ncbi:centrosomal protein of 104 kDa isoform X1 [Lepisosteus oculatus]|uniref:centrosomal protein of 104 kDa isoform X1 n=1 Tax=Lepisosteus oculatus TaxID=7918 RepID=UPI0037219C95